MHLRSLQLRDFRCFPSLRAELGPGTTLFHGDNAQGKTSLLEGVCVLLRLQSPRASALGDCVRFAEKAFALGGVLAAPDGDNELRVQHRESGRKLSVDGENQRNAADYLRHSGLVVWMANDDLALVRGGAGDRRRYLDFMGAQLFPGYRSALRACEKALRSRNFLLKRDAAPRWGEIDAFTRILAEQGRVVTACRRQLVDALAPFAEGAQGDISGRNEKLELAYRPASGPDDDLAAELLARREEEFRKRQTVAGPHRDDLLLALEGRPAAKFASEGQQRTAALALKLAQGRLFLERGRAAPLLLVDDIFGELDPARRNALMAAWPEESQKLITTTHLDWLDQDFGSAARHLVEGAELR